MDKITIAVAGDTVVRSRDGNLDPFWYTQAELDRADLRFLNLETVLTDEIEPVAEKWVHIRTDPFSAMCWLKKANIHAVNVVHNHALDYGEKGRDDTLRALQGRNVTPIDGRPFYFIRNGLIIGMAGYLLYPDDDGRDALEGVRMMRDWCNVPVISLHWGTEHAAHPSPGQIELAHGLIDEGAHLVLGHGPHRVQGFERYGSGLIAYSLGNFNFWQEDVETQWYNRLSAILRVALSRDGVVDHEVVPVWIGEDYRPRLISNDGEKKIAAIYFDRLSADVANGSITWGSWYEEIGPGYVRQCMRSFDATTRRYGWAGVAKMLRWMARPHTWRAITGALRARGR